MVKQYEENLDEKKKKSEKISQKKPCASHFSITLVNKSLDKQLRIEKNNAWIKI